MLIFLYRFDRSWFKGNGLDNLLWGRLRFRGGEGAIEKRECTNVR